jgi:hypothetical protein
MFVSLVDTTSSVQVAGSQLVQAFAANGNETFVAKTAIVTLLSTHTYQLQNPGPNNTELFAINGVPAVTISLQYLGPDLGP